jgi:hypothetical protein
MSSGLAELPPLTLQQRLKLVLKRRLDYRTKQKLKRLTSPILQTFYQFVGREKKSIPIAGTVREPLGLKAGDMVRVRSREEILETLGSWGDFKGCAFMPEMWSYCGTSQRVLKPVRRFVDERDYQVKQCKGLIILDGVMCQGTATFGQCDRSCFYFWREEWLTKVNSGE